MKCIYCNHPYTYELADKQRKCSTCKRKFSPQKIKRKETLWRYFSEGYNARDTSKLTKMHFATIQKYYEKFRHDIAVHTDSNFQHNSHSVTGYDEYLYLPKSLKIEENIDKLQHFLTLSYGNKVYSIMMPKAKYRHFDNNNEQNNKLLLKYLKFHKIAKLSKAQSTITEFWDYFEDFILQYKGVSDTQFVFYLKEAEWRFNENIKPKKATI